MRQLTRADLIFVVRSFALVLMISLPMGRLVAQDTGEERALRLEREGRLDEAESVWKEVSSQHPRSAVPLAHIGLLEAQQKRYNAAIPYYRRAIELDPHLRGVALDLGLAYFKLGRNTAAIETLTPLLTAEPDDLRLNIVVGMAYYGKGDYSGAVPYLNRAASRDPQNLQLLLDLGHSCLLSKQMKCTAEVYDRMASIDANSAEAHMLKGESLDELKDTLGAIKEFEAATKVSPSLPNVHFGLGYLLWTQKQYPEAADQFRAELTTIRATRLLPYISAIRTCGWAACKKRKRFWSR